MSNPLNSNGAYWFAIRGLSAYTLINFKAVLRDQGGQWCPPCIKNHRHCRRFRCTQNSSTSRNPHSGTCIHSTSQFAPLLPLCWSAHPPPVATERLLTSLKPARADPDISYPPLRPPNATALHHVLKLSISRPLALFLVITRVRPISVGLEELTHSFSDLPVFCWTYGSSTRLLHP
jgi:hypothetical protein